MTLLDIGILATLITTPVKSWANPSKPLTPELEKNPVAPLSAQEISASPNDSPQISSEGSSMPMLEGSDNAMSQVTSVSQLSDVQPSDWAFQALQSLVERYGVIAGYPDSTFRGNRALTRYEFAAGLNAALDRVNELIASGTSDLVNKEDLDTLQRLQQEFTAELATLRGRVDALEASTAEIEANQFSTTTKLEGDAIFVAADSFGDRANNTRADDTRDETQAFLAYRVRLDLQTSFTGEDQLTTGLQATNVPNFSDLTGTSMTRFTFERQGAFPDDIAFLNRLYYRFPVGAQTTVWVGTRQLQPAVFAPNLNSLIGGFNGASSRFSTHNPTIFRPGFDGAGAALAHKFSDQLLFSLGYIVNDRQSNDPATDRGIFNGNNLALAQLTLTPTPQISVGLTYGRKYFASNTGFNLTGGTGSAFARNPFGQDATTSDNFGVQLSWKLSQRFNLGGWFGYTLAHQLSGGDEDATIINGALTFAFSDLFKKGNIGGFIVGVPPKVTSNDFRAEGTLREDPDTSLHLEAFYTFRVNDNFSVTPDLFVLTAPEHNDANQPIWVGVIRTSFSF